VAISGRARALVLSLEKNIASVRVYHTEATGCRTIWRREEGDRDSRVTLKKS
jgi:hypothetical protein